MSVLRALANAKAYKNNTPGWQRSIPQQLALEIQRRNPRARRAQTTITPGDNPGQTSYTLNPNPEAG
ncbi:hypothetical protein ADIS_0494 [Lunatimonas lonarensis]|uniref:Uncharacterized protein n=1 Tax=Lunatimonas lonarensis TaxID=1232681 RepID=R7ZYA6_9BACT|nr:hypothetical protein [Lunatimonas lonarensis]EON79077.1 hypothetical protein ADIS_0494 [Lunatimonas lonarensis]